MVNFTIKKCDYYAFDNHKEFLPYSIDNIKIYGTLAVVNSQGQNIVLSTK